MHLLILSRKRSFYSTKRLVEAAKARGHAVTVADPADFHLLVQRNQPSMFYRERELTGVDLVIPRIGARSSNYGLAVVRQLDMMGVPVLNNAVSIARSRDKLRALQLLTKKDIDVPTTVCVRTPAQLGFALKLVGGTPVIVKLHQGTQGIGVMIAETPEAVESLLQTLWGMGQDIILQQFIHESRGKDIRAIVVGGKVVCAMRRKAKPGGFRSNLHLGGEGRAIDLDLDERYGKAAVEATKVIGLEVAGVDILEAHWGPKILEINSSPGLEGIEEATGVDVAGAIIERAEAYAAKRAKRTQLRTAAAESPKAASTGRAPFRPAARPLVARKSPR